MQSERELSPSKRSRLEKLAGAWVQHVAAILQKDDLIGRNFGIRETSPGGERCDMHVLDQWCHLGTVSSEEELRDLQEGSLRPLFDLDTYKILTRYLLNGKHRPQIVPLTANTAAAA